MDDLDHYVRLMLIAYPYVEAARLRQRRTLGPDAFDPPETSPAAPLNKLGRQRRLSDPSYRAGVGVNTDTLYTSAWLDLSCGPLVARWPTIDDRYYSVQAANADSSAIAAFGSRTHGSQLPDLWIYGPDHPKSPLQPHEALSIRAGSRYVNLPGRIWVDPEDPADIDRVHTLQDRVNIWAVTNEGHLTVPAVPEQEPLPSMSENSNDDIGAQSLFWRDFATCISSETLLVKDVSDIENLMKGVGQEPVEWCLAQPSHYYSRGQEVLRSISRAFGSHSNGWLINYSGSRFDGNIELRAAIAKDSIFVTVPEDALYPVVHTDSSGSQLTGHDPVILEFDKEPPVGAFWSVTLYDAQGYLWPNAHHRYSINGQTPVIRDRSTGNFDIIVANEPPRSEGYVDGRCTVWLPAPAEPYYLILRLFEPSQEILSGRWTPPPVDPLRLP